MAAKRAAMSPPILLCIALLTYCPRVAYSLQCTFILPAATPLSSLKNSIIATKKDNKSTHGFHDKIQTRRCLSSACQMNKVPNYFDIVKGDARESDDNDTQDGTAKRGVFRRIKERIARTFGGDKSNENNDTEVRDENNDDIGYKPNVLDAVRLKLALAMSGLSNMNVFQWSREEWSRTGEIVPCVVNGLDIIIFASRDGTRLDAFANSCPHLGSPFDLATVERKPVIQERGRDDDGSGDGCVDCIVCPVHRTAFEIQSGDVRGEWCPYPPVLGGIMGYVKPKRGLVKFAVRLRGKNVEVRIATPMKNVSAGSERADGMKDIK
ncbi:hypothetical protein HJC23_001002 [Cyclotella cryptica]|uniref:Rieske domain-containing protein n=1 Tax=Cyclotella cryptica TaxID=29204 RepID=A0ABD3P1L1_9STRA